MKYFENITTAEELKTKYRELAQQLHPDHIGGNAEQFKEMQSEYQTIAKRFGNTAHMSGAERRRAEQEAEDRRRAEEERKAWEREEAERKAKEEAERAKHRPEYLARCAKWEHLMKEVPAGYEFPPMAWKLSREEYNRHHEARKAQERKQRSARRANILAMCRAAFPGVKFSLTYSNGWGNHYTVEWQDGPTVAEFRAATDLDLFVSGWDTFDGMTDCAGRASAMFTDFARKYNGADGEIKVNRVISNTTFERVRGLVSSIAKYEGNREKVVTWEQWRSICKALNLQNVEECERRARNYWGALNGIGSDGFVFLSLHDLASVVCGYLPTIKAEEKPKQEKPEFKPVHNDIYKKVLRTMGAHALGQMTHRGTRGEWIRDTEEILSIYALIDFAPDCGLFLGNTFTYRHSVEQQTTWSHFYSSTDTNDRRRVAKYAEIGITIKASGEILAVSPEIVEGLKADRLSVEQQRKEWEEGKTNTTNTNTKGAKRATVAEDDTTTNEAPAEGLELINTAEGVAVVGDTRTTYANRKAIKAHGAKWNKTAQRWEATDPEGVAALRAWFGMSEEATTNNTTEQPTDTTNDPDTLSEEERPTAEDLDALARIKAEKEKEAQAEAVARAAVLFADLCQTLGEIATAQRAEAERIAKEAKAKANQAEADQLRRDIATMSEQLAKMGEALRQMSDRLATLTKGEETTTTAPNDEQTTHTTTEHTQAPTGAEGEPVGEDATTTAGNVWAFGRYWGTPAEELHEIRSRGSWFELVVNIYDGEGSGQRFPDHFKTYGEALQALQRFRPGSVLISSPEGAKEGQRVAA